MNKAVKSKWVKALRSGKYIQATGTLFAYDAKGAPSFCCLGVLKDIQDGPRLNFLSILGRSKYACGLSTKVQNKLADFNDLNRWSFKRIATWIEKNL